MQGTAWLESTYLIYTANASKKVWTLSGTRSWPILLQRAALSPSAQPMVPFQPQISADCFLQLGYPTPLTAVDALLQLGYLGLLSRCSSLFLPPVFLVGEEEWNEKAHFGKMVLRKEMPFYITNEHVPQMLTQAYLFENYISLPIHISLKSEANLYLRWPRSQASALACPLLVSPFHTGFLIPNTK